MTGKRGNILPFLVGAGAGIWIAARLVRRRNLLARANIFQGKVVLITGASGGIGRAMAHAFVARGANLVLAARSTDQLQSTASECRAINPACDVLAVPTDVTDEAQRQNLIATALEHFGQIDILVNNAGIVQGGSYADADPDSVRRQIEVNLLAAMRLTQIALPSMIRRRQGQIVNISSVMGRHAIPFFVGYSVSKYGLSGFGEGLRRELAGTSVRVLTASLGFVNTRMVSEENAALLRRFGVRVMTPEFVAHRILDAITLGQVEVNIGGVEFLAEWITRISPRLADWMWRRFAPPEFARTAAQQHTE